MKSLYLINSLSLISLSLISLSLISLSKKKKKKKNFRQVPRTETPDPGLLKRSKKC